MAGTTNRCHGDNLDMREKGLLFEVSPQMKSPDRDTAALGWLDLYCCGLKAIPSRHKNTIRARKDPILFPWGKLLVKTSRSGCSYPWTLSTV